MKPKKIEHSKKCCIVGTNHEHWFLDKTFYYKNNRIARFICNNPRCKGTLFIDCRDLGEIVKPIFREAKKTSVIKSRD